MFMHIAQQPDELDRSIAFGAMVLVTARASFWLNEITRKNASGAPRKICQTWYLFLSLYLAPMSLLLVGRLNFKETKFTRVDRLLSVKQVLNAWRLSFGQVDVRSKTGDYGKNAELMSQSTET